MKLILKILTGFLIMIGTGFQAKAQHNHSDDVPSVHGMLLLGSQKVYLSHLPMFHSPHDYQVILEVSLEAEAMETYLKSKSSDPSEKIYTIVPDVFVLPEVVKSQKSFSATIFKGHFERGGIPITAKVSVNISKVIYFKKFDPAATHPNTAKYIYFGDKNEIFGAHLISAKPDFDHMIEVGTSNMLIQLLKENLYLEVDLIELDTQAPVKPGSSPLSTVVTNQGPVEIDPYKMGKEIYIEFGDLSF